jgi:hypothetical protein
MMETLPPLAIRILQKCAEQMVSKTDISQYYKKYTKAERETAVALLLDKQFIVAQVLPRPDTRKAPTFYTVSKEGERWLQKYYAGYPGK